MSSNSDTNHLRIDDLDNYQESLFAIIIRVGLYIGAVFQFVCILAVLYLPDDLTNIQTNRLFSYLVSDEDDINSSSNQSSPQDTPQKPVHGRTRKQDKKKKR